MKYYSEKTNRLYESEKELKVDEEKEEKRLAKIEAERKVEKEKQDKLSNERKERAKEVNDAFEAYVKGTKELYDKFIKLRNKFIEDYHEFHMTYRDNNVPKSLFDVFDEFFNW